MRNLVIWKVLIFFYCITMIKGHIKDFIIENENDLKRFGVSSDIDQYHDDDIDSEWMYDTCGYDGNADAAAYSPYAEYDANDMATNEYDMSQIDPAIMQEIIRQMSNDPRFEHLTEHLNENSFFANRRESTYTEDRDDYFVDYDENLGSNEIE